MSVILAQPDGLHLLTQASLSQLRDDEALSRFAGGLLHTALTHLAHLQPATFNRTTLAEALRHLDGWETYPLLTALLVLDAEIHTTAGDERRVLPLPGFLSYRSSLAPERVRLETVRLPPLNPGGRYGFTISDDGAFLAVRLDWHPRLNVAGHVRLAISSPTRPPARLLAAEQRLDRQVLSGRLIEMAIEAGSRDLPLPLSQIERLELVETLKELIYGSGQ